MRLAMRLPNKGGAEGGANDTDPRDEQPDDVIDLASRNAFPAVTQKKGGSDALGLVAGVAIIAGLGAVTFWGMNAGRLDQPQGVGGQAAPVEQPPAVPAEAITQPEMEPAPPPAPVPAPAPVNANAPGPATAPATNPYASPTVVFDASALPAPVGNVVAPGEGGAAPSSTGKSASDFASRIGGVGGGPAQATAMVNPQTTVIQGTLIPAVLETAIDTDVPGYVRAVVSQDVRSFDGTRVLIPRSSRLIGQYQSGVQGGQKRAYVIWTRLIRPDGASVNLASPAVGFDGTTGLRGKVDGHFFKRFGSAMLLSVVGGLTSLASSGTSVILGGGQSAAAAAVQQDSQIGPTIRVGLGAPIRVFAARDLDFSQVN